jgi:2-keto-4-pentenoate hydratase/2-oxohepta-3-ene-1,7-dioic acid hydratase in catechol pathway
MGIKASPTAVLQYGDNGGAIGYLVGEENRGLEYMFIMMNAARFSVGMQGIAVSERAYQIERSGQWMKGKSLPTFGPVGPWLVTSDEAGDVQNLKMWLKLNDQYVQNGSSKTMIFNCQFLVHYISQFMHLDAGDIITTGTPPGVGLGMKPPLFLKGGDTMEVGIEGLGVQHQHVKQA